MFIQKQHRNIYSPLLRQLSLNQFDTISEVALEELCLERVRVQRQKVEELTRIYELQKEAESAKNEEIKKLKQTIEQLQLDRNYQEAYEQLKSQYEKIVQELEILKYESQQRMNSQKSVIQQLLGELQERKQAQKTLIQQISLLQKHWTNLLNEKEEEIVRIKQEANQKVTELKVRSKQLEDQLKQLKQLYSIKQKERKSTERSLRKSSKAKELELEEVRKTLKKTENQCSKYRLESSSKENSWRYEKQELNSDIQTLNMCIKSLRKQVTQKIVEIESLKECLKRQNQRYVALEERGQRMMKEFKDELARQKQVKKRQQSEGAQIRKLELQVERLRRENIKHVEDYNILQIQYNRMKMEMEKKQHSWKTCSKLSKKSDCCHL